MHLRRVTASNAKIILNKKLRFVVHKNALKQRKKLGPEQL